MKKILNLLTVSALAFLIGFGICLPSIVEAAEKTGLWETKDEIGVNWTTTISLYNKNSKATYIYTSKNKKMATGMSH